MTTTGLILARPRRSVSERRELVMTMPSTIGS